MLFVLLEVVVVVMVVAFLVSQTLIPLAQGRKMFPIFRRYGKLERKLDDAT